MEKKEAYEISTNMNDGFLEIIITGSVTGRNISKLQKEIDSLRETICDKLLVDVRSVNEGSGYAEVLYHLRSPLNAKGKTAIVDLPTNEKVKPFFETVFTLNTVMKVKWFINIDAARDWLKSTEGKRIILNL